MRLPEEVRERLKTEFDRDDWPAAASVLEKYGDEPGEEGGARVLGAVLDLANGDFDELKRLVEAAKEDYRDVLFLAQQAERNNS